MIGKKGTAFKYTFVWSKLYSFVDTKFFIIITCKKVEEPQITHTYFIVTTRSEQLSWLINIRYWKIVVRETGIRASCDTITNTKFYMNAICPGWKMTEWIKNKWTESVPTLLRDVLLEL